MAQPKILPPTLRSQKRYIVGEVISENKITYSELVNAIWNSMLSFLGELGSSEAKLWFVQNLYKEDEQLFVIKCRHDYVEQVRAVLALIQMVGETRATVRILGVTGTIKSAKTKYIGEEKSV